MPYSILFIFISIFFSSVHVSIRIITFHPFKPFQNFLFLFPKSANLKPHFPSISFLSFAFLFSFSVIFYFASFPSFSPSSACSFFLLILLPFFKTTSSLSHFHHTAHLLYFFHIRISLYFLSFLLFLLFLLVFISFFFLFFPPLSFLHLLFSLLLFSLSLLYSLLLLSYSVLSPPSLFFPIFDFQFHYYYILPFFLSLSPAVPSFSFYPV